MKSNHSLHPAFVVHQILSFSAQFVAVVWLAGCFSSAGSILPHCQWQLSWKDSKRFFSTASLWMIHCTRSVAFDLWHRICFTQACSHRLFLHSVSNCTSSCHLAHCRMESLSLTLWKMAKEVWWRFLRRQTLEDLLTVMLWICVRQMYVLP